MNKRSIARVLSVLAMTLLPAALLQAAQVRWEAEAASKSSLSTNGPYHPQTPQEKQVLSGGAWLSANYQEGDFAAYDIVVPEAGTYHFYVRKFWHHGPMKWRFDQQPWTTLDQQKPLMGTVEMRKWVAISWIDAGTATLEKGPHQLRIELLKVPGYQFDKAAGLDCFLLSTEPWLPEGATTRPATTQPAAGPAASASTPPLDDASIPAEADSAKLGLYLPRTMSLLEASRHGNTRPIRILFYGQSIVAQGRLQSTLVGELRKRYPQANIVPVSNAIGGYTAPKLLRTVVHDVVPFRPDLVVFDDYEGEKDGTYEQIIRFIRSQTTAEILMWSPHLDNFGAVIDRQREEASAFRRDIAARYECEFADVRGVWGEYLKRTGLPRTALLQDAIHNSNAGCELMAHILARHFVSNASASPSRAVRTISLTDESSWGRSGVRVSGKWTKSADGQGIELRGPDAALELRFTGVRVDLVGPATAEECTAAVTVDGQSPSSVRSAWVMSRPSAAPIGWFPAINTVAFGEAMPLAENWTAHFHDVSPDGKTYKFRVTGSRSGADGEGDGVTDFKSTSGRVQFKAADITIAETARVMRKSLPGEFDVTWRSYCLSMDQYRRKSGDAKTGGDCQALLNGLANQEHQLKITPAGNSTLVVRELVVHEPPYTPAASAPAR